MNRFVLAIMLVCAMVLGGTCSVFAVPSSPDSASAEAVRIEGKLKADILKAMTADYKDWKTVELNGRITSIKFFIKPSVKLFMKRGESLMISVRVPLKGEVARLEADKDSVLVVNKLNNAYVRESLEQASKLADITLSDLQDVFIGRVFIAGKGTLTKKDGKRADLYADGDGFLVVPSGQPEDSMFRYGFNAYRDGRVSLLMVSSFMEDAFGQIGYDYSGNGFGMELLVERKAKRFRLAVDFDAPKWGAKGFSPIEIGNGMRQVSVHEFIKQTKF